jgi:hypothetical protein
MRAEGRAPLFASDIGAAAERILNGREIVSP